MKKFKLYNLLVPALISLLVLAFASYTNTYSQNTGNFIDNIGSKFDDDDKSGLNVQLPDPTPDNDIKDPSDLSHETLPDEISESQQEQEPSNAENNDKSEKTETSEVSNSNKGTGKNNNVDTQPDTDKQIYYEEIQAYKELIYYKDEALERYINYKAKNPDYSYEKVITYVNAGIDQKFYENIKIIENGYDLTVLVNKFNKLPDNFKPDLVRLDDSHCAEGRGPQYLHKTAADAFVKMREDAKLLGLDITAYGTYRSVETQHRIWNNAVNSGRTIEDVDSLNARGGHSEHHTG
ncbi:MAG: M15 family metallopeptidase, partial [Clostridiaceae bacterium]|nr:M15 family metallopeptidase [Clostridiaceae bacterium]